MQSSARGNALFVILICITLFAALSYAVTQSGKGSGNIGKEQATIYAAQVVSAANKVKEATTNFIVSGTPVGSITCKATLNGADCGLGTANASENFCSTGSTCLFSPTGGGASVPQLPKEAFDLPVLTTMLSNRYANAFAGPSTYQGFVIDGFNGGGEDTSVQDVGTAGKETVLLAVGLKEAVCAAINAGLGISGIPVDNGSWDPLTGAPGKQAACFLNADTSYSFYMVLAVR